MSDSEQEHPPASKQPRTDGAGGSDPAEWREMIKDVIREVLREQHADSDSTARQGTSGKKDQDLYALARSCILHVHVGGCT